MLNWYSMIRKKESPEVLASLQKRVFDLHIENEVLKEHLASQRDMFIRTNLYMNELQNELEKSKDLVQQQNQELEEKVTLRTAELSTINAELQTLLYRSSHDLKAPLCTIKGLVMLLESLNKDEEHVEICAMMNDTIYRQEMLLQNLSFLGSVKSRQCIYKEINLMSLLKEVTDEYKTKHPNVHTEIRIDTPENPVISSDTYLLTEIIRAVISNCFIFRKEGTLEITLDMKLTESTVILSIRDNGIGIKEKFIPLVFDMFYRANEQSQGSGLGLFCTKSAVEKMGGSVILRTIEGSGTEIIITLPLQ